MKVYELMSQLERMPSGAVVHFSTAKTQREIDSMGVYDRDDHDEDIYDISGEVLDVDLDGNRVFLRD